MQDFNAQFLYYKDKNETKRKKNELIFDFINNFELKLDFTFKFCNATYLEQIDDNTIAFYFQLLVPPKLSLYYFDDNLYEKPEVRENWERINNFFLLRDEIDELYRIHLINNSVLRIVI